MLAVVLLALLLPSLALAQDGPQITESTARVDFPLRLEFSIKAQSSVSITDIRLNYRVEREGFAEVTSEAYLLFEPRSSVSADWSLDMRKTGGFPPGTVIWYWWTVKDERGQVAETQPAKLPFEDARFKWRALTEGKVTVLWYEGDDRFAREIMDAAQQAIIRLEKNTGATPQKPVFLYIYGSTRDLLGAMIHPQEWTGGAAYTRYNVLVIGIATSNLVWGKGAITHELSHLIVHQMTLNPYNELPPWLDEGLAMYNEGLLNPGYTGMLAQATRDNKLISVRSLASPFSANTDLALLSYAQSYSIVEYLITQHGQPKMLELLMTFREGASYDGALQKVYGFDMDGLNTRWREYAAQRYKTSSLWERVPVLVRAQKIQTHHLVIARPSAAGGGEAISSRNLVLKGAL